MKAAIRGQRELFIGSCFHATTQNFVEFPIIVRRYVWRNGMTYHEGVEERDAFNPGAGD